MSTPAGHPAAEPTPCGVSGGIRPEHGRSLRSSAGTTWCTALGCERTWDYDRLDTPCPEPVWAELSFADGVTARFCEGHTRDAHMYVRPAPPTIRGLDGLPFAGAPYDEGAPDDPAAGIGDAGALGPYAHAVVDALRAEGIIIGHVSTTGDEPSIYLEFDHAQCLHAGYTERICLDWNATAGWRYGIENPDDLDGFLWAVRFGGKLLPTPAEMVDLVDRLIFHTRGMNEPDPEYRRHDADDDLAGQLHRAAHGHN
ncbi:DUF6292 family protein (plasmid) [Saccharothrix sp. AJ9571]|nr:DUF6292 family protein [Saccharothrix sp. AJ9571]